ncbi:MAG: MBL fold metallo-hydrolase [Nanoarchaeota archaeon]|nr:MBL fold metallo-hydrolase [Nanoarchaeota archaeon]
MKLTIIYNNEANPNLKSGWGFSCLIEENGKKVLFDTGCEGPGLLYNIKELGYEVRDINVIVISHQHWDHTGGLFDVLELNNKSEVFVLNSFSEHFKNEIRKRAEIKEIKSEQEITENIYTTGLIKNEPDEQALILKTNKGIIVVVGCSHPGVDKILEIAKKYGKIYAIIGGFHGFSDLDALRDIEIIGACHCTQYMNEIKERFPKQFREIRAGDVIEI